MTVRLYRNADRVHRADLPDGRVLLVERSSAARSGAHWTVSLLPAPPAGLDAAEVDASYHRHGPFRTLADARAWLRSDAADAWITSPSEEPAA